MTPPIPPSQQQHQQHSAAASSTIAITAIASDAVFYCVRHVEQHGSSTGAAREQHVSSTGAARTPSISPSHQQHQQQHYQRLLLLLLLLMLFSTVSGMLCVCATSNKASFMEVAQVMLIWVP